MLWNGCSLSVHLSSRHKTYLLSDFSQHNLVTTFFLICGDRIRFPRTGVEFLTGNATVLVGADNTLSESPWHLGNLLAILHKTASDCAHKLQNKSLIDNFSVYFRQGHWKYEGLFIWKVSIHVNFFFLFLCRRKKSHY